VVIALCGFALVGWQGASTIGRNGADDSNEHTRYAQYMDAHWRAPGKYQNYEYATPPLFHVASIGMERLAGRLPSRPFELWSNTATRLLWLLLLGAGAVALTSGKRRLRFAGLGALALGAIWGLDEALSLARSQPWCSSPA
jgi:hypothetical protein